MSYEFFKFFDFHFITLFVITSVVKVIIILIHENGMRSVCPFLAFLPDTFLIVDQTNPLSFCDSSLSVRVRLGLNSFARPNHGVLIGDSPV